MGSRRNTLGLREQQLLDLIREWESHEQPTIGRRRYKRQRFLRDRIYVKMRQPDGQDLILKMACRNLSSGGISLLHNAFIHPGTECTVVLEHRVEGPCPVAGRVVRCTHRWGVAHEVGVQFTSPIVIADFVCDVSPDEILTFETIDPQELEGVVLVVDPSPTDFAIACHYLKETRLRLRHAKTINEAETLIREGAGVIIIDLHMEGEEGAVLLHRLRAARDMTPVIGTTVGLIHAMKVLIASLPNVRLISKPFDEHQLLCAVAEFLLHDSGGVTSEAEIGSGSAAISQEAAEAFRQELQTMIVDIEKGMQSGDIERCRTSSLRIAGSAPGVGLTTIAKLAKHAADRLNERGIDESKTDILALLDACKRHIAA